MFELSKLLLFLLICQKMHVFFNQSILFFHELRRYLLSTVPDALCERFDVGIMLRAKCEKGMMMS